MDVLALITSDHAHVRTLFQQFDELGPDRNAERTRLARTITETLHAHDKAEEETLYEVLQERLSGDAEREQRSAVLAAAEEHALAEELIQKLETTDPLEEEFLAKFAVLRQNVEQHIQDEETRVHPIARATLETVQLDALGERFRAAKKHAMA